MKNMNSTKTTSALVVSAALAIASTGSQAALIAYEGFNYAQGTALNATTGGGTGWTTDWSSNSWRTNNSVFGSPQPGGIENSTGLTYANLPTVGNAARNENSGNQNFRSFAPQAATGTYWISFLMQKDTTNAQSSSFGISLFDGGTERNFMGNAGSSVFGVAGQGSFNSTTTVTTTPSLFLARYNMGSGVAHFWLNSDLSAGTPANSAAFNGTGGTAFTAFTFNRVRLGMFDNVGSPFTGSGYLDEIRIGTAFVDVVPEPSAALLGALGGLILLRRRRA